MKKFIAYIFSIIFFLIFLIIKPLKKVTITRIFNTRIGHFLIEPELLLLKKKYIDNKKFFDLNFYYLTPFAQSCNFQVEKMLRRKMIIIPSLIGHYVNFINKFYFKITNINIIQNQKFYTEDKYLLLHKFPSEFKFSKKEIAYGEAALKEIGLLDKKFVCVVNRDNKYLEKNFKKNYDHHSYRNSSIKNYLAASEYLSSKNIFTVRMGKDSEVKIEDKYNYIFDYSNSKFTSDFLDLYIPSKCQFWISGETGIATTAKIFRKPIVSVNRAPFKSKNWAGILKNETVTIWKKYYDNRENKIISYKEIMKRKLDRFQSSDEFKDNGITLIENSSDDILMATTQLYEMLNNKLQYTDTYQDLEKTFWNIYGLKEFENKYISTTVCYKYLQKNLNLLELN